MKAAGTKTQLLSLSRMHRYFIKTPWLAKKFFPDYIWQLAADEKTVYLSFDDGPHPEITPWVLDLLKQYHAKASFFCIGDNVNKYPSVYQRIIDEGHAVGNHTYHHLNGWKTEPSSYIENIRQASQLIHSNLFRPPYGRIRSSQAKQIAVAMGQPDARVIMWDVLSGDFDQSYSGEQCLMNVVQNISAGSIIVFHDSEKAYKNLEYCLPKLLHYLQNEKYLMKRIEV